MSLPRSTGPLRSIATWSEFPRPKSRRRRDEGKSCEALAAAPASASLMFRSHDGRGSARSRELLPEAGDLGIRKKRKAPGQQKRPSRPKRYATGDVAWVMHSEVDASHSHQQYDPDRHRQNRDLTPGSLNMPGHNNGDCQIEGCGRRRVAAGIGQARNLDELCNDLRASPVNV